MKGHREVTFHCAIYIDDESADCRMDIKKGRQKAAFDIGELITRCTWR